MKRNLILASILATIFAATSFASTGTFSEARIYVPFNFYLEEELLPAGDYIFNLGQVTDSSIIIRSADGKAIKLLMTKHDSEKNSRKAYLHFNHYNGRYFLSSVVIRGKKASLTSKVAEAELWAQTRKGLKPSALEQN